MLHQFSCPEDGAVENEVKQKTPNMYPQYYMYHVINYPAPFFPHNTGQSCTSLKPISVQTFYAFKGIIKNFNQFKMYLTLTLVICSYF